jgi:CRP-like cAMP-binding protein/aminoglycoside phosphotransferase (APT) family kinase protein
MAKQGKRGGGDGREAAPPRRTRVNAVDPIQLPDGRFSDEGPIGQGGRSLVHMIYDQMLLRRSAMKLLAPALQPSPDDRERFIEEAQITGQLDHPNIVPIHEVSVDRHGRLYFTMKLVDGHTLEDLLRERTQQLRRLDWIAPFLEILVKVCDAIAFAHSRGVIHRDIKPANIMVGTFGQVYVMDWGMARLVDGRHGLATGRDRQHHELDRDGVVLGTPAYMPPEQAHARHAATDERSDIFSLGATLYQVMTGVPPYDGHDFHAQLDAARACMFHPPESMPLARRLPPALARIATRAMAANPADRYPTATAMKDDLVALLRGESDLPRCIFAAGSLVAREGERGDAAYIIVEGTCRVFKTVDGQEIELRTMGPGDVFGETAILSGAPRSASVQALETLTVQVVTPEELEEGLGLHTVMGRFVRTLAVRFREADERVTALEAELARLR